MEEKISLPYIFHILESPLGCPNSLFGSFGWFLRVVQIVFYRSKGLSEQLDKTIWTNDKWHFLYNKCHFLHDNGRLLHNNSRLFHDNGRLLWKTNGREKNSSISNSIINKDILRDLWKMEEVLYFFLVIYCPASAWHFIVFLHVFHSFSVTL